jgi:glycosyltransferase involved in cell wall biosynthesis
MAITFLVHGDPLTLSNYSGIPYHLLPALRTAAGRAGTAISVVDTSDLLNVQELLQHIASLRHPEAPRPSFTPRQKALEINVRLFRGLETAETETDIGAAVEEYYQHVAETVGRRVGQTSGPRLSQNYFFPFTGPLENVSYYLDARLTDFFFNDSTGVVDHSWRLPVLVDLYRRMERASLSTATSVFCFSASLEQSLSALPEMAGVRTRVLGAGPALATLPTRHPDARTASGTLLFVGLDFDRKGGDILLRATAELREHHRVRLRVVTRPEFHVRAAGVEFLGPCGKEELAGLYRSSDIFVFPTLFEPFGLVVCEAMAYGLPVVATRVGAIPEILGPDATDVLVNVGPPAEMAAALANRIGNLLVNEERRATLSTRGLERIATTYNWDVVAVKLVRALMNGE